MNCKLPSKLIIGDYAFKAGDKQYFYADAPRIIEEEVVTNGQRIKQYRLKRDKSDLTEEEKESDSELPLAPKHLDSIRQLSSSTLVLNNEREFPYLVTLAPGK